jgi:hypothetical protein
MLNKISIIYIITTIFLSIELIVCLDSEDICYTTPDLVCRENYGYQCGKYICTLNAELCDDYDKLKIKSLIFGSLQYLINFQKKVKSCSLYKLKRQNIDLNQYCLNSRNCFENRILNIYNRTISNKMKRVDCKCQGEYRHQCNRNYCGYDSISCEIMNKLKLNTNEIKDCNNEKIYSIVDVIGYSRF